MSTKTGIEWTEATWNPFMGCTKVSPGCAHCYMFREQRQYGHDPEKLRRSKTKFDAPLRWKEPRLIFTCSWSDWFHEGADAWRNDAWGVIRETPQHTYQILTKRPENIVDRLPQDWGLHALTGLTPMTASYAPDVGARETGTARAATVGAATARTCARGGSATRTAAPDVGRRHERRLSPPRGTAGRSRGRRSRTRGGGSDRRGLQCHTAMPRSSIANWGDPRSWAGLDMGEMIYGYRHR